MVHVFDPQPNGHVRSIGENKRPSFQKQNTLTSAELLDSRLEEDDPSKKCDLFCLSGKQRDPKKAGKKAMSCPCSFHKKTPKFPCSFHFQRNYKGERIEENMRGIQKGVQSKDPTQHQRSKLPKLQYPSLSLHGSLFPRGTRGQFWGRISITWDPIWLLFFFRSIHF